MAVIAGVCGTGSLKSLEEHCRGSLTVQRIFAANRNTETHNLPDGTIGSSAGGLARRGASANPRFSLVADVRLDNRLELADRVGLGRAELAEVGDPDLLLAAWSRWGADALDHIAGEFAFAVYDSSRRSLTLARDPFGDRPLNYSIRNGRVSFASMPAGVWPDEPLSPNLTVLAKIVQGWDHKREEGFFHGISRVAPGTLVEIANGSCQARRYWRPKGTKLPTDRRELVDAFRTVFDEAVAARLPGRSSPSSTMLSSGFDSSAVTGTAAHLLDRSELLTAYSSAPARTDQLLTQPGRFADESPIAADTARMLGINHRVIRDGSPILSSMRGLSHYFQLAVPNPLNLGWFRRILEEVRNSGQSILLVGALGNFTISYGGMLALPAFLRSGRWVQWYRETNDMVRTHTHLRWRGALYASFEPFLPVPFIRGLQAAFDRRDYLSEYDFVNPALRSGQPPLIGRLTGDLARDRLYLLAMHDNGERNKGMAALTGVEERDPTSDRRLVEFCLSMRPEHLLHRGEPRPLAREAFSDRMNPRVFDSSSRGFQSADWYARMLKSEALDLLDEIRTTKAADLLDIPKLEAAIDHWPDFDPNAYGKLFPFGRSVSQALNWGLFVAETERHGGRG